MRELHTVKYFCKYFWNHTPVKQLVYYGAVGSLVASIDFSLLATLLALHCPRIPAVSASFLVAASVQFMVNRHYVFRATERPALIQALLYSLVACVGWFTTVGIVELGVRDFGLPPLLAKLTSIPVTFLLGFLANRYVTFRNGPRDQLAKHSKGLNAT